MLYYALIIVSVFCIALQFSLTKLYQIKNSSTTGVLLFSMLSAVVSLLLFLCLNGFRVRFSAFSCLMALVMAALSTANGILGILAVSYGKVSVFTMFMMLGGMLLPFLYGVLLLNEPVTPPRAVGLVLLAAALVVPLTGGGGGERTRGRIFIPLCLAVFVLNGCVSIVSKAHQIHESAVDTNSYLVLNYLFTCVLSALLTGGYRLFFHRRKSDTLSVTGGVPQGECPAVGRGRAFLLPAVIIAAYALVSGGGYLLQLIGAKHLPASVLYPIVTGGTVVLSGIAGRVFFREKITPRIAVGMAAALAATILFLF